MAKSNSMTSKDSSRIQSAGATNNGGKTAKGSFGARAQSAGAKNSNNNNKGGKK
ncbi:MAG: hypothetical protein HRT40_12225 [Campylobacteraceae bacterium]|nr:hypothetical protein [Campylobacteraceae bacterium]